MAGSGIHFGELVIKIITIEREYGCGGGEIAQKIAERLGWKLWDQLLTYEIARLSNCEQSEVECREERVDPLYYRLFKSIMRGSFEGSLNVHRLKLLDADSIQRITEQVVQKAASTGNCVIVGRGSQHFLRDRDDTLRVFLYAPREEKVRRLKAGGITEQGSRRVGGYRRRGARRLHRKIFPYGMAEPSLVPRHAQHGRGGRDRD